MFFAARGEPPEVFDPIKEPFDAIARPIGAEAGFPAALDHRWDVGGGAGNIWRRSQSAS